MLLVLLWIGSLQALLVRANMRMQLFERQAPIAACSIIPSIFSSCGSATPGFSDLSPASKAPCLCYSLSGTATVWVPEYFDEVVTSCGEWVKTVDPADYTVYQAMENFCSTIGDVLDTPATAMPAQTTSQSPATASITATTAQKPAQPTETGPITAIAAITGGMMGINNAACTSVVNILASCIAATPAFRTLPSTLQAACACYSNGLYDPSVFDVPYSLCANYVATADPVYYSEIASLAGFCDAGGPTQTMAASSPIRKTIIVTNISPGMTPVSQETAPAKQNVGSSSIGGACWNVLWVAVFVEIAMVFFF